MSITELSDYKKLLYLFLITAGIYRRFYPDLLSLQDKRTVKSHSSYWTFENIYDVTQNTPVPDPGRFLFHGQPEQLKDRSIVAINLATLRLDDSDVPSNAATT